MKNRIQLQETILMINNLASHLIAFGSNSISVHFLYLSKNSIVQKIIKFYSDILLQTMMIKFYVTIKRYCGNDNLNACDFEHFCNKTDLLRWKHFRTFCVIVSLICKVSKIQRFKQSP